MSDRSERIRRVISEIQIWRHRAFAKIDDALNIKVPSEVNAANELAKYLMIEENGDLEDLEHFLDLTDSDQGGVWEGNAYRLFISHQSGDREALAELKKALKKYGVHGYLAHDDIKASTVWTEELEAALGSMDALAAIYTEGFAKSSWCNQEIGFALGRGVPVFQLLHNETPSGFGSPRQGFRIGPVGKTFSELDFHEVAKRFMEYAIRLDESAERLAEVFSAKFKLSRSYAEGHRWAELLNISPSLPAAAKKNVLLGLKFNEQVLDEGGIAMLRERSGG